MEFNLDSLKNETCKDSQFIRSPKVLTINAKTKEIRLDGILLGHFVRSDENNVIYEDPNGQERTIGILVKK